MKVLSSEKTVQESGPGCCRAKLPWLVQQKEVEKGLPWVKHLARRLSIQKATAAAPAQYRKRQARLTAER